MYATYTKSNTFNNVIEDITVVHGCIGSHLLLVLEAAGRIGHAHHIPDTAVAAWSRSTGWAFFASLFHNIDPILFLLLNQQI